MPNEITEKLRQEMARKEQIKRIQRVEVRCYLVVALIIILWKVAEGVF